jgi:AcrR family transcriptional regulator
MLVDAAFRCIADRGFEGLRLRLVAAEAGIDHSTLHHYFATKEALVAAVLDRVTRQFAGTFPTTGTPAEQLHDHLASLGRLIRTSPALFTVLAELDLRGRRDPAIRQVIERDEEGWRAALADLWQRGEKQHGWAAQLPAADAAELVIAMVKGVRLRPGPAWPLLERFAQILTQPAARNGTEEIS